LLVSEEGRGSVLVEHPRPVAAYITAGVECSVRFPGHYVEVVVGREELDQRRIWLPQLERYGSIIRSRNRFDRSSRCFVGVIGEVLGAGIELEIFVPTK